MGGWEAERKVSMPDDSFPRPVLKGREGREHLVEGDACWFIGWAIYT